jgi:tRNA pseudouridine38-40 synthase
MTPDPGVTRLRLHLAYDGTDFSGWAVQPGRRTVQGELEAALARVLGLAAPVATTCAGRTDAGVHARGQVCHIDLPEEVCAPLVARGLEAVRRALAGVLPEDVHVRAVGLAPAGFDARFSALWRRYAYRICDEGAVFDPLRRREVLYRPGRLDLPAMNDASVALLGEHDFVAYCRRRGRATTVRTLRALHWRRNPVELVVADVQANAFCHTMVRSIVGAVLAVGRGRAPVDWPGEVLRGTVRNPAVTVVPPHGLTLEEVGYPPDHELGRLREPVTRGFVAGRGPVP